MENVDSQSQTRKGLEKLERRKILERVRKNNGWNQIDYINRYVLKHPKDGYYIQTESGVVFNLKIQTRRNVLSEDITTYDIDLKNTNQMPWLATNDRNTSDIEFHEVEMDTLQVLDQKEKDKHMEAAVKPGGKILFPIVSLSDEHKLEVSLTKDGPEFDIVSLNPSS